MFSAEWWKKDIERKSKSIPTAGELFRCAGLANGSMPQDVVPQGSEGTISSNRRALDSKYSVSGTTPKPPALEKQGMLLFVKAL